MYSVCLVIFLTLSYICNICATICDIKTEFFFLKKKKENPGNKFTALTSPEKSALGLFSQSWTIKSKLHFFFKKKEKNKNFKKGKRKWKHGPKKGGIYRSCYEHDFYVLKRRLKRSLPAVTHKVSMICHFFITTVKRKRLSCFTSCFVFLIYLSSFTSL